MTIRNVLSSSGDRLAAKHGAAAAPDGRGPTFKEYVASNGVQAELRAWHKRIRVQVQVDVSSQCDRLQAGAFAAHF